MRIGLHDSDRTRFPNLALMKLSAPQNQPNSKGMSCSALIMQVQREIDAVDRRTKRTKEKELEE